MDTPNAPALAGAPAGAQAGPASGSTRGSTNGAPGGPPSGPDEIIHQSLRLRIMATLNALPAGELIDFTRLRQVLGATDGNLGAHLTTLETAGYIGVEKDFAARKPRTRVVLTPAGRSAFRRHVGYLKTLLEDAE